MSKHPKDLRGIHRYVDLRMSWVAATFMATVVFLVNLGHGPGPASIAAAKQGIYTAIASGFLLRLCQRLAASEGLDIVAIAKAVAAPSTLAILFTFGVHSLKGTPEPLASTVPTMLVVPPGFLLWALRKRREVRALAVTAETGHAPP